jgi:hypothetical protein
VLVKPAEASAHFARQRDSVACISTVTYEVFSRPGTRKRWLRVVKVFLDANAARDYEKALREEPAVYRDIQRFTNWIH